MVIAAMKESGRKSSYVFDSEKERGWCEIVENMVAEMSSSGSGHGGQTWASA